MHFFRPQKGTCLYMSMLLDWRQPTPRPSPSQEGKTGDRRQPTPRPSDPKKALVFICQCF
ncbi:hypothetical protein [Okeania hirsuta]|uniref:hypothetical protein n=1 Tax=Okeania hirsuta TaxID=1458930 RepID=UPI0030D8EC91